ncbi:hypothetical protein AB0I89_24235 [Micromonospora sp. NPDC049801]|uniref:hypothetical protein n=1 Tax=unclassified Micromonospora TaxID=2617518 RepID=UPI0033EC5119
MTAPTVEVFVSCPDCNASIPITVWAEFAGRADDGELQATVLGDMIELKAHSLTCNGSPT